MCFDSILQITILTPPYYGGRAVLLCPVLRPMIYFLLLKSYRIVSMPIVVCLMGIHVIESVYPLLVEKLGTWKWWNPPPLSTAQEILFAQLCSKVSTFPSITCQEFSPAQEIKLEFPVAAWMSMSHGYTFGCYFTVDQKVKLHSLKRNMDDMKRVHNTLWRNKKSHVAVQMPNSSFWISNHISNI